MNITNTSTEEYGTFTRAVTNYKCSCESEWECTFDTMDQETLLRKLN